MTRLKKTLLVLASGLLIFNLGGCIFSPDDDGGGDGIIPPPTYDWPDSKETLMANFKKAYSAMDFDGYMGMLHEDYQFIYMDDDGTTIGTLYFNDEKIIATNMFSGNARTNAEGNLVGGISSIAINKLDIKYWEAITAEDREFGRFEGAEGGLFDMEMVFYYDDPKDGNTSSYTVKGFQYFVVAPFQAERNGITVDKWIIVGQKDQASFGQ